MYPITLRELLKVPSKAEDIITKPGLQVEKTEHTKNTKRIAMTDCLVILYTACSPGFVYLRPNFDDSHTGISGFPFHLA